ncbi:hypothetical protein A8L34_22590 [Bacillus sp. FJAT-27264]|uniref:hypothetical protein n=1 Tax=Paenibacillus sp. (strain DSM 101736 / FJAT-27264) TaxID=1850362 RepID=UPI00080817B4|nr:hypothetical protein [Bacillus sp. FJAT-27264]OBZ08940.1 hypothetical protein A8L34_22590 [Bacillus sp. FJAT-27264]
MRLKSLIVLLFVLLVGCGSSESFKPDTFSEDDLAIVKVDDEKQIVKYGMSREDAEKILGPSKTDKELFPKYDFGVQIIYRDDKVVAIGLTEDSEGVYKSSRGAEVGMKKEGVKKLYSEKYGLSVFEQDLDYIYDSRAKRYLGKVSADQPTKDEGELVDTYLASFRFDDNGDADSIFLSDRLAAVQMR